MSNINKYSFSKLDRESLINTWLLVLEREPSDEVFILNELNNHALKSVIEYANLLKESQEYQDNIYKSCELLDQKKEKAPFNQTNPIELCERLWNESRIGVVNWHLSFTKNIQRIYNNVIVVDRNSTPEQVAELELDVLINHHEFHLNKKYGDLKYIALNYWTITKEIVKKWNQDPLCIGIIDFSMILTIRHPQILKPIRMLKPKYNDLTVYKNYGSKVITLIQNYQSRFEKEYELANTITPYIYQGVYDVEALADAKWLLHLRHRGFVCNAVMRALGSGVPVIMDTETWYNGFFGAHVRHNDNAIVLPTNNIKEFLENCPDSLYERIKSNCVRYAERDRTDFDLN